MIKVEKGKLYICPTPIGNLEDITIRTLNTLEEVDIIAAEDTRHSIKLLNHYEIKRPLTSYHEHNMKEKGPELIEKLNSGLNIGLISDAGMPGISDPGQDLIKLAIEEDIEVIVLPGATASITALVASGLDTERFVFEGFLSAKKNKRLEEINDIKEEKRTIIIYESPHRLLDTLKDILSVLGNRRIGISRELTKKYEEKFRGSIEEAIEHFSKNPVRGEFVLVMEGNLEVKEVVEINIEEKLRELILSGESKRDSIRILVEKYSLPKNQVYKESLKI